MSNGKQDGGYILPEFTVDDLGTSFKVVLLNSVRGNSGENGNEIYIPDYQGLIKKIAISRAAHPMKLKGNDVRFLRKTLGLKAKDLAEKLDISAEHLSRCEAGDKVLSPNSEKVLRSLVICEAVYVLRKAIEDSKLNKDSLLKKISKLLDSLEQIMSGLKISPVHETDEELVFHFRRIRQVEASAANDDETVSPEWLDDVA